MSGLAAVLAGHRAPGVFRWESSADPAEVRHTVEHAGWAFGAVDGWTTPGKTDLLTAIGQSLLFPSYYGANLDALADCLRDLASPSVLLWDGWGVLARDDSSACAGVLDVLTERSAVAPAFAVLLRGAGPVSDLTSELVVLQ